MKELLMLLHTSSETDENVWSVAFSTFMSLISKEGKVLVEYARDLTPLATVDFLKYLPDEVIQCKLVRFLVHSISLPGPISQHVTQDGTTSHHQSRNIIDIHVIESLGGIGVVIDLYVAVRSVSAKCNLFAIIFSYIIQKLQASRKRQTWDWRRQAENLFQVLCLADAPQYFWKFFICLPDNFSMRLVSRIRRCQNNLNKVMPGVGECKAKVVRQVTKYLEKIATEYLKLEPNYAAMLQTMTEARVEKEEDDVFNKDIADKFDTLNSLLHSNDPKERRAGETWLFGLIKALDGKPITHQVRTGVASIFDKVTSSTNPRVRGTQMRVTERMITYLLFGMKNHADRRQIEQMLELFNTNLAAAVTQDERDWTNLTTMFYVLFNFIVRYRVQLLPVDHTSLLFDLELADRSPGDTPYALFLLGKASISTSLAQDINISLFSQLFTHLPTRKSRHNRIALLLIMINKCRTKKADLDALDLSFFRNLLKSRDPEIAWHAAKFLLEHLRTNEPQEYCEIVEWCVMMAQKTGDETLLTNPYLQINALLALRNHPDLIRQTPEISTPERQPNPPATLSSSPSLATTTPRRSAPSVSRPAPVSPRRT